MVWTLGVAFLVGIAASFTPCIYPMIPITIGILQAQAKKSLFHNFLLATSYVTGMATVYATLGYFAATSSLMIGQWMSNPLFVIFLVIVFVYLAFSMFGYYEIYIPRILKGGGSQRKVGGSLFSSFILGAITGSAASPCLTPALALLLAYVAKTGNPLIGFLTLFSFSFGMGLLLIVVGTFSTAFNVLPRAGGWMNEVKMFFGFLMLAVSVYFMQPVVNENIIYVLYGSVLAVTVGYYGWRIVRN